MFNSKSLLCVVSCKFKKMKFNIWGILSYHLSKQKVLAFGLSQKGQWIITKVSHTWILISCKSSKTAWLFPGCTKLFKATTWSTGVFKESNLLGVAKDHCILVTLRTQAIQSSNKIYREPLFISALTLYRSKWNPPG